MRLYILAGLLALCPGFLVSQVQNNPVLLSVMGRYSYSLKETGQTVSIVFVDDPTRCDPERGYVPVSDQIKHFTELMVTKGINISRFKESKTFGQPPYTNRHFQFTSADQNLLTQFLQLANQMNINVEEIRPEYEKMNLEYQDQLASYALQDAISTANMIASYVNMKIDKILNVDDDTFLASIYEKEDSDKKMKMAQLETLLQDLNIDLGGAEGGYTLRVTFALIE